MKDLKDLYDSKELHEIKELLRELSLRIHRGVPDDRSEYAKVRNDRPKMSIEGLARTFENILHACYSFRSVTLIHNVNLEICAMIEEFTEQAEHVYSQIVKHWRAGSVLLPDRFEAK